jgi:hypothetical protein
MPLTEINKNNNSLRNLSTYFAIILSFFTFHTHPFSVKIMSHQDMQKFSIVDASVEHTGTDATIRKITDGKHLYILKQITDESLDEQFLLINDAVASAIGSNAQIPVNEVFFIPYTVAKHLKKYPDRAATLHSYVSGKDLEKELPAFIGTDFTLHQRTIKANSIWQQQCPLTQNAQGLTRDVIESMSIHNNLALLCALDTFVGNSDRSDPNIFYDHIHDSFAGIDQAASFSQQLPTLACDRIKELVKEDYCDACSSDIINGLRTYQSTLRYLYDTVTPCAVIAAMQDLIPHIALNAEHASEIKARIHTHTRVIEFNYASTLQLMSVLDQLLVKEQEQLYTRAQSISGM